VVLNQLFCTSVSIHGLITGSFEPILITRGFEPICNPVAIGGLITRDFEPIIL